MKVNFFNERDNRWHFDCEVELVEKSDIQHLYDEFIATVEYDSGEYLNIYAVNGELKGYIEEPPYEFKTCGVFAPDNTADVQPERFQELKREAEEKYRTLSSVQLYLTEKGTRAMRTWLEILEAMEFSDTTEELIECLKESAKASQNADIAKNLQHYRKRIEEGIK